MRAGLLRNRVTLQKLIQERNEIGEAVETWVTVAHVWAEIRALSGREWYEARQLPEGEISTTIVIRFREDIDRTMRILHNARKFNIVSVLDPDGRKKQLQLMCLEVEV